MNKIVLTCSNETSQKELISLLLSINFDPKIKKKILLSFYIIQYMSLFHKIQMKKRSNNSETLLLLQIVIQSTRSESNGLIIDMISHLLHHHLNNSHMMNTVMGNKS